MDSMREQGLQSQYVKMTPEILELPPLLQAYYLLQGELIVLKHLDGEMKCYGDRISKINQELEIAAEAKGIAKFQLNSTLLQNSQITQYIVKTLFVNDQIMHQQQREQKRIKMIQSIKKRIDKFPKPQMLQKAKIQLNRIINRE